MAAAILIVEDDLDSRVMLATALELEGHTVVTAANGAEGLARAREHHPRLIILDLMMPVMSGEAFRRAQLQAPDIRAIPVLVVSAHPDAPQIARDMQALACLTKPVDFDALAELVSSRCGPR